MTACAGYKNDNCLTLTNNGKWITSHQLKSRMYIRIGLSSWSRGDEIILLGGGQWSGRTSEVLTHDNSVSTYGFELIYDTKLEYIGQNSLLLL